MGIWKKLISGFLAVVMVVSMLPVQVFAEEEPAPEETTVETTAATEPEETEAPTTVPTEPEPTEEPTTVPTEEPTETTEEPTEESTEPEEAEETEETFAAAAILADDVTASGTCGESLTWTLYNDGMLTISGTGKMDEYMKYEDAPWYAYRDDVLSIVIGTNVSYISIADMQMCSNYSQWLVAPDNRYYSSDEYGVLFDKDMKQLLRCPLASNGSEQEKDSFGSVITQYTIPIGVESIGDDAFYHCKKLNYIQIPDSVTDIGSGAFSQCDGLESITLPMDITVIKRNTFSWSWNLSKVSIPNGVQIIEDRAFDSCAVLSQVNLPKELTTIGAYAFDGCGDLGNITIPAGVSSIGEGAFSGCGISSIEIPDGITCIEEKTFYLSKLTSVTIPSSVVSVGPNAFYSWSSMDSEIVLKDVYYNGTQSQWDNIDIARGNNQLFEAELHLAGNISGNCGDNLTWTLDTNGLLTISGKGAMTDYSPEDPAQWYAERDRITSILVEQDVTLIGEFAFTECTNLTSVTIHNGTLVISKAAFAGCSSLSSIIIPKSVVQIEIYAFNMCNSLEDIYYTGTGDQWRAIDIDYSAGSNSPLLDARMHYTYVDPTDPGKPIVPEIGDPHRTLAELTPEDYLAFSQLSYEDPPDGWETDTKTVRQAIGNKWEKEWANGIKNSELYGKIAGWKIADYYESAGLLTGNGFAAYAFSNENNEILIAYRGSIPINLGNIVGNPLDVLRDWIENDVPMIFGSIITEKSQFYHAIAFYEKWAQGRSINQIAATGHSLGGGWGDVVSAYSGCKAETFNAISLLDVAYSTFPEYMSKYFQGVDNWNFVDHVNEFDVLAGAKDIALKNYIIHKSLKNPDDGLTFANHSLNSMIEHGANGELTLTSELDRKTHSSTLKWDTHWEWIVGGDVILPSIDYIGGKLLPRKLFLSGLYNQLSFKDVSILAPITAYGGSLNDSIHTGKWGDVLAGGGGNDDLNGDFGSDVYCYRKGDGLETIHDLQGILDRLYLIGFNPSDRITTERRGNNVVVLCNGLPIVEVFKYHIGSFEVIKKSDVTSVDITSLFKDILLSERITIACPVSVEIIEDATGNIVQTLQDGELGVGSFYTDYGYFYVYQDESGEYVKVADLFEGYSVRIIGADEGMMDVTVAELVNDELTDTYKLADVPVNTDMVATIESNPANDMPVLVIDDNGDGEADRNIPMLSLQGGENVLLTLDREYLALEKDAAPETIQATVLPAEWGQLLNWHVENETEGAEIITITANDDLTCTVTPVNAGTAYLVAEIAYNDTVFSARCRIDVVETEVENPTESGTVIDKPIEEQITEVTLGTTAVTSELYQTDYAQIRLFMDLEQNIPQPAMAAFSMLSAPENNGAAVTGARFGETGGVDLSQYFDLVVKDDSTLLVVPTAYAVRNAGAVKSAYANVPVFVTVGSTEMDAGLIRLTVRKTAPKLKVSALIFNSFISENNVLPLTVTGGQLVSVRQDPGTGAKPNLWPEALRLDEDGLALELTDAIYNPDLYKANRYSGTVKLLAKVEGYTPEKEWPLTVSVKANYTLPKAALSASGVTVYKLAGHSAPATLTLVSKEKGKTLEDLGVRDVTVDQAFAENYQAAYQDGLISLTTLADLSKGETILLNVSFTGTDRVLPLRLKVTPVDVLPRLTQSSLTLNPEVSYLTPVAITFTPANFRPDDLSYEVTRVENRQTVAANEELNVAFDAENNILNVATVKGATLPGTAYTVSVTTGGKTVKLTVKTLAPDRNTGTVNITATLRASGFIDLSFPDSEIVITPTFKNYLIQGNEIFDWEILTKTGEDAGELFDVAVDEDGTAHVKATGLSEDQLKNQYSFRLMTRINGKEEPVTAALSKLVLKRTTLAVKLAKTSISLNAGYMDEATVQLTPSTKNFTVTNPDITYPQELDVAYVDGALTVKVIPGVTESGKSYKITVIPDKALGGNAAILTVKTPTAGKASDVTAKVKVSGSIDAVRSDTFVTVTPDLNNFLGQADYQVEVVDAKTNEPVSGFRIVTQEDGTFRIFADSTVDHSQKYKVSVTGILTDINGETVTTAPVYGGLTMRMSGAKINADKKAVTLYAKDRYSSEIICLTAVDATLNGVEKVTIREAKGTDAFTVRKWGGGKYAICFADNVTPDQLPAKAMKLILEVTLKGNNTGKPNTTVPVTVNILK